MKFYALLFSIYILIPFANGQSKDIKLPKISKEILKMRKMEQKLRKKLVKNMQKGKTQTARNKKIRLKTIAADRNNTARLNEIINQYGWPTIELVGERASNGAWLIAQHADRNPLFQEKCLALLKAAVDQKQANPRHYAYLYDRVQLAKGNKQRYATQANTNAFAKNNFFKTIEDEANVQKRREEMGISQHIEGYAKALGFDYKIPSPTEAKERANAIEQAYKTNIEKAKDAMKNNDYTSAVGFYTKAIKSDGYTNTEDYIELARAVSLGKHKDANWASFYLIKAVARGYQQYNDFDTNKDFQYIKEYNPDNWTDLMNMITTLNKQKSN